jgi:hypothetical protein
MTDEEASVVTAIYETELWWPVNVENDIGVPYCKEPREPPPYPFVPSAPQGRLSSSLVRGRD